MKEVFANYGIYLTDEQEKLLGQYYELLIEWNEKMNLTSITNYEDVVWKHFLDSSLIMTSDIWKQKGKTVFDVGTGAGFPGIVLAILNQENKFILLDSLNKRIDFLTIVKEKLSLSNIKAYHGRAEIFARKEEFRNQFDFVVSRAVAELPVLLEYCVPFVKENGFFVSYKGKKQDEIKSASHALNELDATLEKIEKFTLQNGEERKLLFIQNHSITKEKYPRKEGKPKKKPL